MASKRRRAFRKGNPWVRRVVLGWARLTGSDKPKKEVKKKKSLLGLGKDKKKSN